MLILNEELAQSGIKVPESGKYDIWIWARGGSSPCVGIGDMELSSDNFVPYRTFAWGKLGEIELVADRSYVLKLDASGIVKKLAVVPSGFNPGGALELMNVYPDDRAPVPDERMRETRHTHSPFSLPEYKTKEEWAARCSEIRRKILVHTGLWPMPERGPLNPKVVETLDRDGYIIEKMHIETMPGVYFPCALYRPKDKTGPFPGIINPHGHWATGRQAEAVQKRCANFALQGYLAFSYNMVGYIDNNQIGHDFRSDAAYLWSVSVGGLQLWNSLRAMDFITSLPEVDLDRVACTGCSGGGTQTFMVTAVDDRIKVAAPINMVSSFFQGGCLCENAPGTRLDAYNVEIAACAAPRPQILIGATGDWTDLILDVEYPDVLSIYHLSGDEDKLTNFYQDAGHNYNQNGREAVYKWFGKWLLNETDADKLSEVDTPLETVEMLNVFDDENPRPDDALDQNAIVHGIIDRAKAMLEDLWPKDEKSLAEYCEKMVPALADVLNVKVPEPAEVHAAIYPHRSQGRIKRDNFNAMSYVLSRSGVGDQIPATLYTPKDATGKKVVNLVVHPDGKAAMVDFGTGNPNSMVSAMLENDCMVLAIDAFLTGEHPSPFEKPDRERESNYFSTFSAADEALRVQDIMTAVAYLQGREDVSSINLVGLGEAGLWCLLANTFVDGLSCTVVDAVGFDSRSEAAWVEHLNVPGILRAGGFDTAIAGAAPRLLMIHNTADAFDTEKAKALYEILEAGDNLSVKSEKASEQEILDWLK